MFEPNEIIFAVTDECNLHCKHCFVKRNHQKLDIELSKKFLISCKNKIQKVGFSGGEPFLYVDFLVEIIKTTIECDLLFDQIMTNGDWWKNEDELSSTLQKIYDVGFDGKIGLSWDSFHGQNPKKMETFINKVVNIFGENSLNIQTVISSVSKEKNDYIDFSKFPNIPIFYLPQTYLSQNQSAWNSKKWFKEDFCAGPGNIFYVHPNGKIAPCCGFANENEKLIIGTINDDFEQIMKNASKNEMIDICFNKGLSKYRKELKKQKIKFKGKCGDNCSFCDFICNL